MHYYSFHIGDYATHTVHLEPLEDLAYRRMLDVYYLHEQPLPADVAAIAKVIRMRPHLAEVQAVLDEFFVFADGGWRQRRCDEQIMEMQGKQAKARVAGQASAAARKAAAKAGQSKVDAAAKGGQAPDNGAAAPAPAPDLGTGAADTGQPLNAGATSVEQTFNQTATDVQPPIPIPLPTPLPTPGVKGEGVGSSAREPDAPAPPVPIATRAGLVCKAIRRAGVADANPFHPELRVLIERGAGEDFFAALAAEAVQRGKGRFPYLLATATARMEQAAALADQALQMPHHSTAPPAQNLSFGEQERRAAMARWEEQTGRIHPNRPPDMPLPPWAGPQSHAQLPEARHAQ